MPAYSRFQPFSSTDIPDEDWDAAVAQWRAAQDQYDPVSPGQPDVDPGFALPPGQDPTDALRTAEMPHAQWQALRAQQLATPASGADGGAGADGGDTLSGGQGEDVLQGGAGTDQITEADPKAPNGGASQPVNSQTTDVFRPGPDGKLHPIPGWHTTGPFDFGAWAHNVDWGGVGRDLRKIAIGAGLGMVPLPEPLEQIDRVVDFYKTGRETLEDLKKQQERARR